ncbi:MAG: glycosyltransferase family protein [Candidatus Omnitrophica bacterium]|nr:glycosyltransferase family protein [Candidatus Omnitrophota bacterium]
MILGILQARTSSSRLSEKVLKPLLGVPMLLRQIERLKRSRRIDKLIVATSELQDDDPIEKICQKESIDCFRGSLDDVLDRFYQAAQKTQARQIVRLTGDCPLADPGLIDQIIEFHLRGGYDYTSNAFEPTYPDGLDAEVLTYSCLKRMWKEAALKSEREHVTAFIYHHKEKFRIGNFKSPIDYSRLRWTVDESEDFELITKIYEALYFRNPEFDWQDVLNWLKRHPEMTKINEHVGRNEGYAKSRAKETLC